MKSVNRCIICDSTNLISHNTTCSPFLAERIWNSKFVRVNLVHCNNCDFTFYNPRLDYEETYRLYKNYRGSEYQQQREKYEKWYTKDINNSIGNNAVEIEDRKSNMSDLIKGRFDTNLVGNILDYGGDKGQFICDEFAFADRYVYDISNVPLLPGIKRISDITESAGKKFDFIMCCHVLEHVSDPDEVIDKIMQFSHVGTKFYFELPFDLPILLTPVSSTCFSDCWIVGQPNCISISYITRTELISARCTNI